MLLFSQIQLGSADENTFGKRIIVTLFIFIALTTISICLYEVVKHKIDGDWRYNPHSIIIQDSIGVWNISLNRRCINIITQSHSGDINNTNEQTFENKTNPYGNSIVSLFTELHCLNINNNYQRTSYPNPNIKFAIGNNKHNIAASSKYTPMLPFVQKWKYLLIAGLYDTGTNVLQTFFTNNCLSNSFTEFKSIEHEVPWKKHSLVTLSMINSNIATLKQSLGIVIVKDPLTWIKSICKAKYYIKVENCTWYENDCPQYFHLSKINWHNENYPSLIHLWNQWYSAYIDIAMLPFDLKQIILNKDNSIKSDANDENILVSSQQYTYFPFIFVRFEDLLFKSDQLLSLVCNQCVNGQSKTKQEIYYMEKAVKYHGRSRSRSQALDTYSKIEYRYKGFNKQDLIYIDKHINHTLVKLFKYEFDVNSYKLNQGVYGLAFQDRNPLNIYKQGTKNSLAEENQATNCNKIKTHS